MYRNTKTILAILVFVFGLFSVPNFALAAYTDVTMTNDVVITVGSTTLNITGSSTTIDTITVNANSFSFSMSPLSFIQVTSQARHTLNSDANAIYIGNNICTATESTIGFYNAAPTYSPTVTVTPATTTCTLTPAVLGGNGVGADAPYVAPAYASGGGGGGGGSSYIAPTQTVTQTNTTPTPTPTVTTQTTQTEEISTKDDSVYYRKLSLGSKGEDVTALQTFLEKKGYLKKGLPKGYFGASTKTALIKYQKSIKLTPSGIFGPDTRTAVEKSSAKAPVKTTTKAKTKTPTTSTTKTSVTAKSNSSSLSVGSKGTEVTELQTFLEDKGFLKKGLPKGYFGETTATALKKYQKSVGLTPSGIYGSATKAKITSQGSTSEESSSDTPVEQPKKPASTTTSTKPTSTSANEFKTNLSLGASGTAVTEMQTFLEQKGFLPKGQPKGQFGLLTKTALMKYQKSVGLNPSGIFGPDTRAYINTHN